MNATTTRGLIICAGLGTTGTSALDRALGHLGLVTAKWSHITEQPSNVHRPSNIMKPLLKGRYKNGMFDTVDAILDSPAIDHLPWILEDYPASKIILTLRNPFKWAIRRTQSHSCSSPPFRTWYVPYGSDCVRPDLIALQHAYRAWYAYVRAVCYERKIPLLELDLFNQSDDELWKHLEDFVGRRRVQHVTRFGGKRF